MAIQKRCFSPRWGGNADDRDVTKDNVTRFQHEKAKERLKAFAERAKDIDDIYGWQGFGKSFEILYGLVNCDTNALPEQIAQLYDASIAFASFAHFDRDLQLAPSGNYAALNANDRRLFLEIVRTVAPWIRRFPTARNLDDETGQFLFKINDTAAHSAIITAASSASLITQSDRDLILQLLAAIKRQGFPAEKAVKRGAFLTAGLFTVVGAVFGMTMDRMEPVQELAEFLASKGEQIFEVLGNEPADIQAAMRHMVDEARKQVGDAPTLPAPPRETPKLSTKRREKLQKHQG